MDQLGLPVAIRAYLFDLDGELTETATIHAKAWQQMFDGFLSARAGSSGQSFVPFDVVRDYDLYVDGKPRDDGTRSFLAARGVQLPDGTGDPATADTIQGLGKRKNSILIALIRKQGVEPYCHEVLVTAGIAEVFDARIDGVAATEQHLAGKPAPDTYLAAAGALAVTPAQAAVFEDALATARSD